MILGYLIFCEVCTLALLELMARAPELPWHD